MKASELASVTRRLGALGGPGLLDGGHLRLLVHRLLGRGLLGAKRGGDRLPGLHVRHGTLGLRCGKLGLRRNALGEALDATGKLADGELGLGSLAGVDVDRALGEGLRLAGVAL